jgi:hypothetical protein
MDRQRHMGRYRRIQKERDSKVISQGKRKAIPVTGRGGPQGCAASRLTDGSKVVSLTRPPPFTPQEDSWYSFLLEADSTPGLEGLSQLKNPVPSLVTEPATFRLVTQCLNQLRYRVSQYHKARSIYFFKIKKVR